MKRNVFTEQPQHGCRFNSLLHLQLRGAESTGQESASLGSPQMEEDICGSLQDRLYLGFYGMPCLISTTCGPSASATIMSKYTAYISHPQHKCLWHFIRLTQMVCWSSRKIQLNQTWRGILKVTHPQFKWAVFHLASVSLNLECVLK